MRSFRRAGAALAAALVLSCAHCPAASAASAPQLLLGQDFPDPDVVKTGSGYFAFSTTSGSGKIPVASAPAPEGPWRIVGDALGSMPKWVKPDGGFWAPDVTEMANGTFVLYFAATRLPNGPMCLGTATSAHPAGPYQPDGDTPLVCVPADVGDIDPQAFLDSDGTRYLLYKGNGSDSGPPATIWSQKLSPDGRKLAGPRTELLRADLGSEKNVVEAPSMVKTPSRYILFYSADTFQSSGYHTGYATAPTLAGAYVKADAPFLSTERLGGAVDGPGGADVVDGNIYFHGWLNGGRQARGLYRMPISFPGDVPQLG